MSVLINENFLLSDSKAARELYHIYAEDMPIVDYHCHIDASEIYFDKRFSDLSEIWLGGDHYKWRLMRACGIDEQLITGNAPGYEKFMAFAGVVPQAPGNPVYHWTHLELQRFFDIDIPLCPDTAEGIWKKTYDTLNNDDTFSARGIIKRMNVEVIITTDDPADSLQWHKKLNTDKSDFGIQVLPCFRPDAVLNIEQSGFEQYVGKLGISAVTENPAVINDFDDLKYALASRIEYFNENGCRSADHGIFALSYAPASDEEVNRIFKKALYGGPVSIREAETFRYALMMFLSAEYARLGWVMELHLGVLRDVNTDMVFKCGKNTGFDCIGTSVDISQLARVLNAMNVSGILPKTIIFSINPNDNAAINTLAGCFCDNRLHSKVQQGSAWWFNDSFGGIMQQLQSFAQYGVLGNFIGMLTDSRSFLSYPRHEYFRRILCRYLASQINSGLYPDDIDLLGKIVQDVSYFNVKEFFQI